MAIPSARPKRAILGIDGTGSHSWPDLHQRRSFVKKLVNQIDADSRCYFLGATDFASNSDAILENGFKFLNKQAEMGVEEVILTGYSRGAASVTYLAHWIHIQVAAKRMKMRVPAIILFDSVCRDTRMSGFHDMRTVNSICENVIHARRDPNGYSRPYMSNASTQRQVNGAKRDLIRETETRFFYASHAGLGGLPWEAAYFENLTADKVPLTMKLDEWLNMVKSAQNQILGPLMLEPVWACRVSLAEDESGSAEVGRWVWEKLKRLNLLGESCSPKTFAPPGHAIRTV